MYKVLLVDDEPAALDALRLAADWESLGFVICGECGNGEEAIRLVESFRPDLVVTDVRMPVMDGLEFVRRIAENIRNDMEFVLVSGYDEFEYAQKAIKYGIRHYVLKPVSRDEISAVISEAAARLRRRDRQKELDAWNRDAEICKYFERFISGAGEGIMPDAGNIASYDEDCRNADGERSDGSRPPGAESGAVWAYAVVKPLIRRASAVDAAKMIHISCSDLKNELATPGSSYIIAHIAPLGTDGYGLAIRCISGDGHEDAGGAILANAAEALRANLARIFSSSFYLSVSSSADSPRFLRKLAGEAMAALGFRFFKPAGSILFYGEYGSRKLNYSLDSIDGREDIYDALESLDILKLAASIEKVFDEFAKTFTAPEIVEIYLINVICKGLELIKSMGGDIEETVKNYPGGMLNFSGLSLDEAKSIFERYCRDVLEILSRLKNAGSQSDMLKVKDYISRRYKSGITIREISAHVYIHPVYLGHLIHKWFGCGFSEYVNRLRIDEAKRLLAETDRKAGDIAVEVGYGDYGVFLKQFEKFTMMKPTEYREYCRQSIFFR